MENSMPVVSRFFNTISFWLLVNVVVGTNIWMGSSAFPLESQQHNRVADVWTRNNRASNTQIKMYLDESSSPPPSRPNRIGRASFHGVSVSSRGFFAILNVPDRGFLPVQVTASFQDYHAATTPEALTIIQLLSGVDMAGAILPPELLAKMLVLFCEEQLEEDSENLSVPRKVLDFIQLSLPDGVTKFSESHEWFQSRVRLPKVTLDEVQLSLEEEKLCYNLVCSVEEFGKITFDPSMDGVLSQTLYEYCAVSSVNFASLALALRYKAPISVTSQNQFLSSQDIQKEFPMFATVGTLQKSSIRVKENIERGFEIHKMMGALRIAQERGDTAAIAKIRAVLDEYDSMADLPTVPMEDVSPFENDENTLQ